jgi:hypothetical protein
MAYVHSAGGRIAVVTAKPWRRESVRAGSRGRGVTGLGTAHRHFHVGSHFYVAWLARRGNCRQGQGLGPRGRMLTARGPDVQFLMLSAPHWLVIILLASPALLWFAAVAPKRLRLRRCKRLGLCLACGDDLRESPERLPGVRRGDDSGRLTGVTGVTASKGTRGSPVWRLAVPGLSSTRLLRSAKPRSR